MCVCERERDRERDRESQCVGLRVQSSGSQEMVQSDTRVVVHRMVGHAKRVHYVLMPKHVFVMIPSLNYPPARNGLETTRCTLPKLGQFGHWGFEVCSWGIGVWGSNSRLITCGERHGGRVDGGKEGTT